MKKFLIVVSESQREFQTRILLGVMFMYTHFMLLNTDRMDVELDELSDSDESTELPKLDFTGPLPLGILGIGMVRSFCCTVAVDLLST